jgi:hypothetical protein
MKVPCTFQGPLHLPAHPRYLHLQVMDDNPGHAELAEEQRRTSLANLAPSSSGGRGVALLGVPALPAPKLANARKAAASSSSAAGSQAAYLGVCMHSPCQVPRHALCGCPCRQPGTVATYDTWQTLGLCRSSGTSKD